MVSSAPVVVCSCCFDELHLVRFIKACQCDADTLITKNVAIRSAAAVAACNCRASKRHSPRPGSLPWYPAIARPGLHHARIFQDIRGRSAVSNVLLALSVPSRQRAASSHGCNRYAAVELVALTATLYIVLFLYQSAFRPSFGSICFVLMCVTSGIPVILTVMPTRACG